MPKLTQRRLKELLHYDPETGLFTWRISTGSRARIGNQAGYTRPDGYVPIRVDGVLYLAHRLAWLYCDGYFPEGEIDHIDRNPSNNKYRNLRSVSHQCNTRNSRNLTTNKSGVRGVFFEAINHRWRAYIENNSNRTYLGSFNDKLEAVKSRWDAEKLHGWPTCCTTSSAFLYLKERDLI